MEISKFIGDFEVQIEDLTDRLNADTEFKKLKEWDSMAALSVIAMIDKKYNVQVSGDEIENAETVGELFNIIKKRL